MIIGITGGIGSGKSTVAEVIKQLGYPVYNSDLEARKLQNSNPEIIERTKALLGNNAYNEDGLNRAYIASVVFSQPDKLQQLNEIVHPVVKADFISWANQFKNQKFIFLECAILFEGGFDVLVDKILLVTASENVRIERVIKRDNLTEEQVRYRMKNQMQEEKRKKMADIVLSTDDGISWKKELESVLSKL